MLDLNFSFWADFENRLGFVSTYRKSATINGENLFDSSKDEVESFIQDCLKGEITDRDGCIHEDGTVQESIDVDSRGLSFWFLDDSLYLIDWTCDWLDGDTPIWPSIDQ